jgi:hypothetical protein
MLAPAAFGQSLPEFGRAGISKKGSLLHFPAVEIKWDADGNVIQDTLLSISNDGPDDVYIQVYMVNGDRPLGPQIDPVTREITERPHPGWNWADCQLLLTAHQPTYWSAATGLPAGCQPFSVLDPAAPAGRPDPDGPDGTRTVRGFLVAWAVDVRGAEIQWNQLLGSATTVHYATASSWEYNAYAFQAHGSRDGVPTDQTPGQILLNGLEYDAPPEKLLLIFNASGGQFRSAGRSVTTLDTDLTVMPVTADLRQDNVGPITTKVKFDIWNMNETRFSGTERCVTCWDQTLFSQYDVANNFLRQHLQTDMGKARVDGVASTRCDGPDCIDRGEFGDPFACSFPAAILGVSAKLMEVSGSGCGDAAAGGTLSGMGVEPAAILYDLISPPSELRPPMVEIERVSNRSRPQSNQRVP